MPPSRWSFLPQINISENYIQRCVSILILNPAKLTRKINNHTKYCSIKNFSHRIYIDWLKFGEGDEWVCIWETKQQQTKAIMGRTVLKFRMGMSKWWNLWAILEFYFSGFFSCVFQDKKWRHISFITITMPGRCKHLPLLFYSVQQISEQLWALEALQLARKLHSQHSRLPSRLHSPAPQSPLLSHVKSLILCPWQYMARIKCYILMVFCMAYYKGPIAYSFRIPNSPTI